MYILRCIFFCVALSYASGILNHGRLKATENPFLSERNYFYENHTVITEDGYKLLLVQIPRNKGELSSSTAKPPILFVHGIYSTFYDFLLTGPGIAFGFKALEAGYDVFLLNTRGNRWSRSHVYLDPDANAKKFWNFSWHEIGQFDLPATINYVADITGHSNISFVGHSQGTSAFLVMASTRPEYNKKIKIATLLAPVSFVGHAQFIYLVLFKRVSGLVQAAAEILQINEVFRYNSIVSNIKQFFCNRYSILLPACKVLIYELNGWSTQINNSIIPDYLANFPAGGSSKQALHYLQNSHSGEFCFYDYGKKGNIERYGQPIPPNYNLSAVSSPLILFYGGNDKFIAKNDESRLVYNLPNVVENVLVPYNKTNHLDILMGKRAEDLVTIPALNIINKYNSIPFK